MPTLRAIRLYEPSSARTARWDHFKRLLARFRRWSGLPLQLYALDPLEVSVLRPEPGTMCPSGRKHDAVGESQLCNDTQLRSIQGQAVVEVGCTGTSSTRLPTANASIFWPGRIFSFSRTSFGMTTWYLGDTVTTGI